MCTKRCPKKSCNLPINKDSGCNKMICLQCQTKFCWSCNTILNGMANPYDHFQNNDKCLLFGANPNVHDALTKQQLAELEDDQKFKEMLKENATKQMDPLDLFKCPQCCCFYVRDRQKINIINCIVCSVKFCFMCKKQLGSSD